MKLSIIIVNEDAFEYLPGLIQSIDIQAKTGSKELILINKGSIFPEEKYIHDYGFSKVLSINPNVNQKGVLYNRGADLASGDYLMFIHSDIYFCPGFFKTLFNQIDSGEEFDFANVEQYYPEGWAFGQNTLFVDDKKENVCISQPWQEIGDNYSPLIDCSESCFIISRKILTSYRFNENLINNFFEYEMIKDIYFSDGRIIKLPNCGVIHFFIELHEKSKYFKLDEESWKKDNQDDLVILQKIINLYNQNQEKDRAIIEHDQQLREIKMEIEQNKLLYMQEETKIKRDLEQTKLRLDEKEAILNGIFKSHGWKWLSRYYRLLDVTFPDGSKRRLIAKLLAQFLKSPIAFSRHLNGSNIKKFVVSLVNENSYETQTKLQNFFLKNGSSPTGLELVLFEHTDYKNKLIFPDNEKVTVSIVIPVYNQWNYTYSCLQSILANTSDVSIEVLIADDVSDDETINAAQYVDNVVVIRNQNNLGFLRNCNNAAQSARGKYILFLNNDTNVQKDWLKYLLDAVERDPTIGLVGSKLVYPDGRLQEAGGVIWRDASGWNYGRLDDPEKPEYNYVKEVDYISGACIMIRTELWNQIGGFDERYVPAYFEDSDLAFEVRKRGQKVVFQPQSIVVHFEGLSHGTDTGSGVKRYQVKNREAFIEKWKTTLDNEHYENSENVFLARDRSKNRKTILVIDHYVPHFDQDAGSRTTYQYLQLFCDMGFNVKFLGDNFYKHEPYTSVLQQMGIEVLYGPWYRDNYKLWITANSDYIDYIYLNRPHTSSKYIDFLKANTRAKIFYYGHDLHFLREARQAEIEHRKDILESSERWKATELDIISKADIVYYPSANEINEIKKYLPDVNVKAILPYMYDKIEWSITRGFEERNDLLFVGGFAHSPNLDGVIWFLYEIYPTIVESMPGIKFYIVGSNPPEKLLKMQSESVIVTGYVSDEILEDYYNRCRLAVVPLRYGAGVKGKVVEAMRFQLPVVTTTIGAEGLDDVESFIVVKDSAEDFTKAVLEVYNNFSRLTDLSKLSVDYINKYFSVESAKKIIIQDFIDV